MPGYSRLNRAGARGVRELAKQPRHHERRLLADVDGVVADPLEAARHERHDHRPLASVGIHPDLNRHPEDVAVEAVDLAVLTYEILGERRVAVAESASGLGDLRAHE